MKTTERTLICFIIRLFDMFFFEKCVNTVRYLHKVSKKLVIILLSNRILRINQMVIHSQDSTLTDYITNFSCPPAQKDTLSPLKSWKYYFISWIGANTKKQTYLVRFWIWDHDCSKTKGQLVQGPWSLVLVISSACGRQENSIMWFACTVFLLKKSLDPHYLSFSIFYEFKTCFEINLVPEMPRMI